MNTYQITRLWIAGGLALLFSVIVAVEVSAQGCDEFCSSIKQILQARASGFAPLRGAQKARAAWVGSLRPPGAIGDCVTGAFPGSGDRMAYACTFGEDLTVAGANALFERLSERVRQLLPQAEHIQSSSNCLSSTCRTMRFYLGRRSADDDPDLSVELTACCSPNGMSVGLGFYQR